MAPRSLWKGQLRLSLVSIPVELYSATQSSGRTSFRQIHKPSGKRVHYDKVVEGIGPVDNDDIVKGYEIEKGEYVLLEPEEIDAVKLETKRTLELVQFVEASAIDPIYYDKPYYLVPENQLAEEAYQVIRDALRSTRKVGIGQLTMRGREYLIAVKPCGSGLLLETLHYAAELRDADPLFKGIPETKADSDLLEVATALIDKKTSDFDASAYKSNYEAALRDLVKRKMKGKRLTIDEDEERSDSGGDNVIDLMATLKKSLEGSSGSGASKSRAGKSSRSKSASSKTGSKSAKSKSAKSSGGSTRKSA
ncbi:Ku protein [Pseudohoeflea coraliihabitans]|uniref:Non-homologous end joining protein Ku n=1 Tax=Pseudohoeflea coraliihabitans TaxID=2860393 RepID=A0ABS6WK25_9HYPH|nr:Ku protein [Pseudohoeflea sp. DP4N28-3]MBW3096298.1 Ku protein [Pseudohoeflea sp. DP4N28-3]